MRAAQELLDLDERRRNVLLARGHHEQVVEIRRSEHAEPARLERDDDLRVRLAEIPLVALGLQHADDLELHPHDPDVAADHGVGRRHVQHAHDVAAQHGHQATRLVLVLREHATDVDLITANREEIRRRSGHLRVRVLVPVRHLHRAILLRLDFGEHRRVIAKVLGIRLGHADGVLHGDAADQLARGIDLQQARAERGDAVLHRLRRAVAERGHGDHRGNADHDAEHREERTHLVDSQRLECDSHDFEKQHSSDGLGSERWRRRGHGFLAALTAAVPLSRSACSRRQCSSCRASMA